MTLTSVPCSASLFVGNSEPPAWPLRSRNTVSHGYLVTHLCLLPFEDLSQTNHILFHTDNTESKKSALNRNDGML
jgi:hypothetical protein